MIREEDRAQGGLIGRMAVTVWASRACRACGGGGVGVVCPGDSLMYWQKRPKVPSRVAPCLLCALCTVSVYRVVLNSFVLVVRNSVQLCRQGDGECLR